MRAGINSHAQSEQLIINIWLKHNAAMTGERVNNITVLTGTTAASHNLHMFDPFVQDVKRGGKSPSPRQYGKGGGRRRISSSLLDSMAPYKGVLLTFS